MWHPKLSGFQSILHRRYQEMINEYPHLKCIFSEPPILSFRRNKNLRNWLVHSCLTKPTPNTHFTPGHSTPCSSKRGKGCKLCPAMSNTSSRTNKLTNKSCLTSVEDSMVTALMSKLNQRPVNSLNASTKAKIVK